MNGGKNLKQVYDEQNKVEQQRQYFEMLRKKIVYSDKYFDDFYEYRHVTLPKELAQLAQKKMKKEAKNGLLSEKQWREIGLQMSEGWIHYAHHAPEPHILLFRREKKLDEIPSLQQQQPPAQ